MTVDSEDEPCLLRAAQAGDEQAFGRLVSRHQPGLGRFCLLMLGCPNRAHHAVCETLLRGWQSVDRVEPSTSARMWLYRLATNVCLEDLDGIYEFGDSPTFDAT
jgi:RNA polymerase sigma-70 factor (ECF subfamily)